ncbi:MAG: hypothetical protein CVU51_01120 [Deltaproteobacteria bacterium HGW-Deltaproteobacteria-1]|jgi:hypothetical protein|nr:MAG: hypothetical protein CVU51_01120 [Deltaproteobacteria bacterium HGW-Deltaproteobacteria-1]
MADISAISLNKMEKLSDSFIDYSFSLINKPVSYLKEIKYPFFLAGGQRFNLSLRSQRRSEDRDSFYGKTEFYNYCFYVRDANENMS